MKNILLVGLDYHHYTREIIRELEGLGHRVTYRDIQPRDTVMKTLRVVAPVVYRRRLDKAHLDILYMECGKDYDLVLFIQAHQMNPATLERLRKSIPNAEFVLYNWDALTNHDYRPQLHCFDRVYTFDPDDAQMLGVNYLPLFCIPAFQNLSRRDQKHKSIYFVGNIVSVQRYEAVQAFKAFCAREQIQFNHYLACTPPVLWRLIMAGHRPWDVSLRPIDNDRFIQMMESSVAVFDFANHKQAGYTMRIIENLCAGKKIITSNPRIASEHFYSDDRIHIFYELDFTGITAFLQRPLLNVSERFEEFYLRSFVQHLIGGNGDVRSTDNRTGHAAEAPTCSI